MNTGSVLCAILLSLAPVHADVVARWEFNGTDGPSVGTGQASPVGGISVSFASGSPSDPATNNSAWSTSSYPAQGTSNKTAGVEFRVSTEGFKEVSLNWSQRVSSSASKYCRIQYSIDGLTYFDVPNGVVSSEAPAVFEHKAVSLAPIGEANDAPALLLRIVAEFESTAAGTATEGYVTTSGTNAYTRAGTIRVDCVEISGTRIAGGNTPPLISAAIPDQTLRVTSSAGPLPFRVSDLEDAPEQLLVNVASDDPQIVSAAAEGTGEVRNLLLRAGPIPGQTRVAITVTDTGARATTSSFHVFVLPINTSPFISGFAGTNVVGGDAAGPIGFTIGDLETDAAHLTVTATSEQPELIPNDVEHIDVSGSGTNRSVVIRPVVGRSGVALISVAVLDDSTSSKITFPVVVRSSPGVLFCDEFEYANGGLCTNSCGLWRNRSGTPGDALVREGQLELSGSRSEDVTATLCGGPFTNGSVLYASFRFMFLSRPKAQPEYFAHFSGGSAFRARIYAAATDVWPGAFKLWVANGSETNTPLPWNLSTNTVYRVVTRYEVGLARTTVWMNPDAESDPGTLASDPVAPVSINAYGLRQDSGLGAILLLDDLRVGDSFASVTGGDAGLLPAISIRHDQQKVVLEWPGTVFLLEQADALQGPFGPVIGARSPFTNTVTGSQKFWRLSAP